MQVGVRHREVEGGDAFILKVLLYSQQRHEMRFTRISREVDGNLSRKDLLQIHHHGWFERKLSVYLLATHVANGYHELLKLTVLI